MMIFAVGFTGILFAGKSKREIDNNIKVYDSFLDFPYNNMEYVCNDGYEVLQSAYKDINFFSKFESGNLKEYDFYKEKFGEFIENNDFLIDPVTNEKFDLNKLMFYFFDMDLDGNPELGVSDDANFTYIYKYILDKDETILWYKMDASWFQLNGSRAVSWNQEGIRHVFYNLSENGEEVLRVFFFEREDFNKSINMADTWYMVALPQYMNSELNISISEKMSKQAYFDKGQEIYYFRVTQKQYDELTGDYFKALEVAQEDIKKVSYSYEELFNTKIETKKE